MIKNHYTEGQKLGNLIFLNREPAVDKRCHPMAKFKCSCGKEFITRIEHVRNLRTNSCGCQTKQLASKVRTIHGGSTGGKKTPEYNSWQAMNARCYYPKHQNYERYQQLGVTVCDSWRNSFENFIKDMGLKPSPSHTIDRVDNTKGYSKENCRWATRSEQQRNKRDTVFLEYKGERKCLYEWAEIFNVKPQLLYSRIFSLKWTVDKAFTTSIKTKFSNNKTISHEV